MPSMRDAVRVDRTVLWNKHRQIVVDTMRLPDGSDSEWVYADSPDTCMVVAITPEGHLVCIKQFRTVLGVDTVELPGGTVESLDPKATAAAELLEETGYAADELIELGRFYALPNETNRWQTYFLALGARKVQEPRPQTPLEECMDMQVVLMPFAEVGGPAAAKCGIAGIESLWGIQLAASYLAAA